MALACIWCVSTLSGIKEGGGRVGGGRERKREKVEEGSGRKRSASVRREAEPKGAVSFGRFQSEVKIVQSANLYFQPTAE